MLKPMKEKDTNDSNMSPETSPTRNSQGSNFLRSCIWVLAIISISLFSTGVYEGTSPWRQSQLRQQRQEPAAWQATLETLMSPDTAESLLTDQQLRRSLGFAVEFTTSLTRDLGHKYDLPSLKETSNKLEQVRRDLESMEALPRSRKRQLFSGLPKPGGNNQGGSGQGGLFGGLLGGSPSSGAESGATPDAGRQNGGLLSQMSSGVISELTKPLKEAFGGIKDKLVQNAGGATFFLGVGVGGGTAQGLNFTDGPGTKRLMEKVAADNGQNASGLNPAIENLGMGLTATLLGAVNIKELPNKFNISQLLGDQPVSDIALALSEGLGGGAAKGLNIGNGGKLVAPRGSNITDAVGALGFGLTESVTRAFSKNGSATPDISSFNITPILGGQTLTQVAFGLADGLGTGAAKGLKMGNATSAAPSTGTKASDVVNAFGFGLTNSVTRNIDTSQGFGIGNFNITPILGGQTLSQVARMLADGIGSGATKGLNLGNARVRNVEPPQGTSAADVAGAFGFGLTESLTRSFDGTGSLNFDIDGMLKKTFPGLKIGNVVQGFARGFLQGAGDSITMMGGIEAMMNGTAVIPTVFPNETVAFNDTLGGAGTGFGQGLGGQGVVVAAELIAKQFPNTLKLPGLNNRTIPTRPLFDKRDLAPATLSARDDVVRAGPGFNLSAIINAETISNGTQGVMDLLQCEGIGGIVLIGVGLIRSGAIPFDIKSLISSGGNVQSNLGLNPNITNTIRQVIPNGTIHFHSRGNFYEIDGGAIKGALDGAINSAIDGIKINSLKIVPFIVLLILHILIAIVIFIGMLPIALCLESARNILARMASPYLALPRKTSKWIGIMYGYVIAPLLVVVFIFGIVVAGSRQDHFRNAHSILGLLSVIFGLPTIALYWTDTRLPIARARILSVLARDINTATFRMALARAVTNQLFQTITISTILTGFAEVSGVALCATQIVPFEGALSIGFLFASISSIGMMLNWLDFYMAWRISRIPKNMKTPDASGSDTNEGSDEEAKAGPSRGKRPDRGDADGIFYPEKSLAPPRKDNDGIFLSEKSSSPREEGTFFYPDDNSQKSVSPDVRSYVTAATPSQTRVSPSGASEMSETRTRSPLPVLKSGPARSIRDLYDNKI